MNTAGEDRRGARQRGGRATRAEHGARCARTEARARIRALAALDEHQHHDATRR